MARVSHNQHSPTARVRVLLVDDHTLVRAGIRRVLDDAKGVEVIGEAADCTEASGLVRSGRPDVVLMDMNGMCLSVLDGSLRFQRQFPEIKLVVMSVDASMEIPERLIRSGIQGCLTRNCTEAELIAALRTVHRGERYISNQLAQQMAVKRLSKQAASPFETLTHRELQVVLLVTQGKNTADIAKSLCLTQKTINGYRVRVMGKLGVSTEVQLTHMALRHGIIELAGKH